MAGNGEKALIEDYLGALGVDYTAGYARDRFAKMPFHTLFGLKKVLEDYGIDSEGYHLSDPAEISGLTPPFLASTAGGVVVVTAVDGGKICYLSEGEEETLPQDEFVDAWSGDVTLSYPRDDAREPDYALHARLDFFQKAKRWVLAGCWLFVLLYLVIDRRLYADWSTVGIVLIDLAGLYFTYLLVQKSANIHTKAADRVCGVLQVGGCDKVLETKGSKFFGLFGWSEVGFAYFAVSLMSMLLFPSTLPLLAVVNVCCLPFTVWSIWYQRFRARHWCTLCVSVQCSLWLLFACYCGGGWLSAGWPLRWELLILGAAYLGVMLGINALMPLIEKTES